MLKLSVIMPVFNEQKTFMEIYDRVQSVPTEKEIIIVDDCSTDGTRKLLQETVFPENVKLICHEKNKGKGAAIRTGVSMAKGELIVIQDADMEYNPQDYVRLMEPIESGEVDVVYGSRFLGRFEAMSFSHKWGNKFLTFLTSLLYRTSITDMETCYKMCRRKIYDDIEIKSDRFDFEPEITSKILKKGYKIKEIPINYKARKAGEGKKISWIDGFDAIMALIRFKFSD